MIKVLLNRQCFQYDVHSLVRAFYPGEEVQVKVDEACLNEGFLQQDMHVDSILKEMPAEDGLLFLLEISFTSCLDTQTDGDRMEKSETKDRVILWDKSQTAGIEVLKKEVSRIRISLLKKAEDGWQGQLQKESFCREADRGEAKNELKRLLYRLLSEYSGRELPWGNLTGIRPTKIAMALLNQGKSNGAIAEYMRSTYYTSNEKTALAVAIANREHALLEKLHLNRTKTQDEAGGTEGSRISGQTTSHVDAALFQNGYSLYIGIPFCPSICLYCSFSSSPISLWKNQVDDYLDALLYEIESVASMLPDRRPDTVYIGGGTPTTLEPAQMERLLAKIETCFDISHVQEFTVEAGRPDSISREKLAVLRSHPVSRISINPQTMNQKTLDFIGRKHKVEETEAAFHLAREMGFDNINMDLIVGLPGEGAPEVEHTMREISRLDPDSVTVHSLAVKRAARLRLFKEEHKELSFENSSEIMDMTAAYTRAAGLFPYYLYRQKNMAGNFENVGYAREGKEGLYNILIMEEVQSILALGAGASTKLVWPENRIQRVENVKDIKNYIDRIDEMIERKRSGLYE